jgi:predicted P-loop ATPase
MRIPMPEGQLSWSEDDPFELGRKLQLLRDGDKSIKNIESFRRTLVYLGISLRFNEFRREIEVLGFDGYGPYYDDHAEHMLYSILHRLQLKLSERDLTSFASALADQVLVHPVREYFATLLWDGEHRISYLLPRYFGTGVTEDTMFYGRAFMIAAVRRIKHPGTKFDTILTLEGPQGILKSTALRTLCPDPDWFTDNAGFTKDTRQLIYRTRGKLIAEIQELSGFNKVEAEAMRAFLSTQVDEVDLKFEKRASKHPRQFVFAATTNENQYLQEAERRFWPVRCGEIDVAAIKADRDQLWAEAVHREASGERIYSRPSDAAHELIAEAQKRRVHDEAWEGSVNKWLEQPETKGAIAESRGFPIIDIYTQVFPGAHQEKCSVPDQRRLAQCLRKAGWERYMSKGKSKWRSK